MKIHWWKYVLDFFSGNQFEKANKLLFESLPSDLRNVNFNGKGKENRIMLDMIGIFKGTDPDVIPVFVLRDLYKLRPPTVDHLDVSKLLKDLETIKAEINVIKSSYVTLINDE